MTTTSSTTTTTTTLSTTSADWAVEDIDKLDKDQEGKSSNSGDAILKPKSATNNLFDDDDEEETEVSGYLHWTNFCDS